VLLRSDDKEWGGSGYDASTGYVAEPSPFHGFDQSIVVTLPPLAALVLAPVKEP
jgi:1,4-alpha-glucan branching enzyme